jgi:hypothetical protein
MVCRNICERIYSKIVVRESHYFVGKKFAGDASVTLSPQKYFVNVVECSSGLPRQKENAKKMRNKK